MRVVLRSLLEASGSPIALPAGVQATAQVGTATASGTSVPNGTATPDGVQVVAQVGDIARRTAYQSEIIIGGANPNERRHGWGLPKGVGAVAQAGQPSTSVDIGAAPAGACAVLDCGNAIAAGEINPTLEQMALVAIYMMEAA